jgi:hypothetical protein
MIVTIALATCGTAVAGDQGGQSTTLTKPLRAAAMDGDVQQIKLHIAKGTDVNKADERGTAPINYAAEFGGPEAVQLLLKAGAKVNVKDANGRTPLISASLQGKKDVVDVLLAAGADVKAKDLAQMTAMHVAAQFGRLDVIESLVKAGGDVNAQDAQMQTPLTLAQRGQRADIVEFLKQNGAKEPVMNMGRGPYGDYAGEQGGPQGPGTPATPATNVEVKIDPNVIREQVKGFEGLAEAIKGVDAKSEAEQRGWIQRRNDNRITLVRAAEKQFGEELTFVKSLATQEKAAKTIKAVDDLSAMRKKRNTLIANALLEERRAAMQEATDQSGMTRGRTAMRGNRTKTGGGTGMTSATNPYGTSNMKMPMKKRPEPNEPPIDADTQAQIQAWTSGRAEDKSSLLDTVHKLDLAELDGVRTVATEEGAKKTAAVISGLMLARQERVEKITKEWKIDDERMQKLQERTGNQPGMYPGTGPRGTTPGTPGQTDQTGTRRTRRYR